MLGLCMRLDEHQLPHSLRSIPDFHFTVPAHKVPVNQEMLSAIKSIVGNDAVQDSVLEESFYFIGEMNCVFLCRFLLISSSSGVYSGRIQTNIHHMSTRSSVCRGRCANRLDQAQTLKE